MERMAVSYFKSLYTRDPSINCSAITDLVKEQVTPDMDDSLCKEFSDDEILDALFQIGPFKSWLSCTLLSAQLGHFEK
jgi:hypothetical protein